MSSSRIIKSEATKGHAIRMFSFELLQDGQQTDPLPAADGFQAAYAGFSAAAVHVESASPVPQSETALPVAEAPRPGPSEEELQRLLAESYDAGFAEGRQQAEAAFQGITRAFSEAIAEIVGLRDRIIHDSEHDLLHLAVMIAKQVIQQEISLDRKILIRFVAEALRYVPVHDDVVICFNPDDCQVITANRQLFLADLGDKRQILIKTDDSVPTSGCIIETPTCLVDARLEAQLGEVFRQITQGHGTASASRVQNGPDAKPLASEQYGAEIYGQQHG